MTEFACRVPERPSAAMDTMKLLFKVKTAYLEKYNYIKIGPGVKKKYFNSDFHSLFFLFQFK